LLLHTVLAWVSDYRSDIGIEQTMMAYAIWQRSHRIVGSMQCSPHLSRAYFARRVTFLVALASGCVATPALPVSLDAIMEQSFLGEPLRIVVPVAVQSDETLSEECIRVIPTTTEARGGIPEVRSARIALKQVASSRSLVVISGPAVNEPAMRITLEAGCENLLRREYVMLFDPPVENSPVLSTAAPAAANIATAPALTDDPAVPTAATDTTTFAPPPTSALKSRASRAAGPRGDAGKTAAHAPAPRQPSKNSGDQLAISRVERGNISRNAQLADVEEQEVILRHRVAELSATVIRMQQEQIDQLTAETQRMREVAAAQAAQRVAEEAARMSPWSILERSSGESWQLIVLVLALATLVATLVSQRRRLPSRAWIGAERSLMATGQSGFDGETYTDMAALNAAPTSEPRFKTRQPRTVRVAQGGEDSLQFSHHDHEFEQDLDETRSPVGLNPTNA